MKKLFLLFCFLNPLVAVFGQIISGQIKNSKTQNPIEYINIGIVGKEIGTVSDVFGNFKLSLNNALDSDTLRISAISFRAKNYKIADLRATEFPKIILLDEEIVQLAEVIISNKKHEPFQLGLKKKYCYPIPLYKKVSSNLPFPQQNYSHEIGARFTNTKTIKLDSIQFNLVQCNLDTLEFRVNIYSIKNEQIKNVLTKPIYIKLTKPAALNFPKIDVTKYDIILESDFLITIENHKQIPNGAMFILANAKKKGEKYPAYYRSSSQSNWVAIKSKKNKTVAISLLAFVH